jgi:Flp pilus assembly protein TadG
MITITRSRKRQRGQAIVESALTMLIFLPVLIGILDFGQFLYFHQSLTERARAGARYGAVHTLGDGSEAVNVAIYNNPAGAGGGATALLP